MRHRPIRRAIVLSVGVLMACVSGASADTFKADGDILTPAIDASVYLGRVAPGAVVTVDVGFVLTCTSTSHVDPGQTVTAGFDGAIVPLDGAVLSVTDGSVGPAPATWPAEGAVCPLPAATFSTGTPSVVTLQAPTTAGIGHKYSLMYHRSIDPFGSNDGIAIRQATAIDITLDVVVNTPPILTPPTVAGGTVEANTAGGWTADWAGLGATDAEDDPEPTATCSPAAGTILSLGTTSVACSVTDTGGMSDSATFNVTVVDTTLPTLTGVPADQSVSTGDPTGTTLTYTAPTASDTADASLTVVCDPASGSHIGLGTTTVTCTAADDSGNSAQVSFQWTVTYVAPHTASATWGEPIAGLGATFWANRGRTIPVKVQLFVDGTARTSGTATLTLTPCVAGTPAIVLDLSYGSGRWNASLDTSVLPATCYTVVATIDGLAAAGGFRLELRGSEPAKTPVSKPVVAAVTKVVVTTKVVEKAKAVTKPTTVETKTGKK